MVVYRNATTISNELSNTALQIKRISNTASRDNTVNILHYMMGKWVYGHSLLIQALEKMPIQPGDTLCIIGCGYGDIAIHPARRFGCRVHAYDIHQSLVRLRSDFEWHEIFNSLGLEILWEGGHNLSLVRKFWEDLRVKLLTTFHDMAKTIYTSWRGADTRDALKRFRQLFSEYGDLLKCKYYIVRRCG